jgi:hypothetical protein
MDIGEIERLLRSKVEDVCKVAETSQEVNCDMATDKSIPLNLTIEGVLLQYRNTSEARALLVAYNSLFNDPEYLQRQKMVERHLCVIEGYFARFANRVSRVMK